ncbi:sensor histidine kinase, partial [Arenibaculum sp.]|uniref:sensor histidine kinase n=1 Tax=Arenibaculum sp. TaxID=2865862 RepID=UPI002E11610E|nr:histidine kinase dimerization/phospho-acceptor domain-containing protein [Arenibaculum sp.]
MTAPFAKRLSFRQARNTVLIAVLLGIAVTAIELFFEVERERAAIADTVQQVVRIVQEPAAKATYDLDRQLAAGVLDGLFSYRPIYRASVYNEFGLLAAEERLPAAHSMRWLSEWLFGGNLEVEVPLTYVPVGRSAIEVGEIRVSIDIHQAASTFLSRSGTTIVNGLVRNLVLGLLLTAIFYVMVTKPILAVSRDMETVTPDDPSARKVRCPEGHAHDEIGFLVGRINELLSAFGATLGQRDQFAADLMAARRRAEEASRAKSQFLATVSHELRTPLNAIIGFSELIKADGAHGAEAHADYAGEILTSGNQLLAIINDILDLAEIDTGMQKLAIEPVEVGRMFDKCIRMLDGAVRDRRIDLRVTVAADLPPALADARALRQIVVNLLSNALKFTPEGGAVELSAVPDRGRIAMVVADNGIGIAPEHL